MNKVRTSTGREKRGEPVNPDRFEDKFMNFSFITKKLICTINNQKKKAGQIFKSLFQLEWWYDYQLTLTGMSVSIDRRKFPSTNLSSSSPLFLRQWMSLEPENLHLIGGETFLEKLTCRSFWKGHLFFRILGMGQFFSFLFETNGPNYYREKRTLRKNGGSKTIYRCWKFEWHHYTDPWEELYLLIFD